MSTTHESHDMSTIDMSTIDTNDPIDGNEDDSGILSNKSVCVQIWILIMFVVVAVFVI